MLIESPLSPPALAAKIGIKADTVRAWIDAGLLEAINVADPASTRPRWRVMPDAWEAFMRSRSSRFKSKPAVKRKPKTTRKAKLRYCSL